MWLLEHNMIHPSVLEKARSIASEEFQFSKDIISELKKDKLCWENFMGFSESYKRIRLAYIDSARKRPEEYSKRLENFISKTRQGKLIKGHGGIDKYYG